MKDSLVRIGLKRKLAPAQSASVIKLSPVGSTEAYSPPPPAGPDSDDEDYAPDDFSLQHLPTEWGAENDTSTTEVQV